MQSELMEYLTNCVFAHFCTSYWQILQKFISFQQRDLTVHSVTLQTHPFHNIFVIRWCSFHFQMILEIIWNLSFSLYTSMMASYCIENSWEISFVFVIVNTFTNTSQIFNSHGLHTIDGKFEVILCISKNHHKIEDYLFLKCFILHNIIYIYIFFLSGNMIQSSGIE